MSFNTAVLRSGRCTYSCAGCSGPSFAGCCCRQPVLVSPRLSCVTPVTGTHSCRAASEGIDGPWSTFELRVGTPSQNVRVLIGTSSTSTLVVLPLGCQSGPSNCSDARGGIFNTTASSTWSNIGNYALGFENNLGLTDAGDFGHDTGELVVSSPRPWTLEGVCRHPSVGSVVWVQQTFLFGFDDLIDN